MKREPVIQSSHASRLNRQRLKNAHISLLSRFFLRTSNHAQNFRKHFCKPVPAFCKACLISFGVRRLDCALKPRVGFKSGVNPPHSKEASTISTAAGFLSQTMEGSFS